MNTELTADLRHFSMIKMVFKLRTKFLTSIINDFLYSLESNFKNRFTTGEFQTQATTIGGNKNAQQKKKKQKSASLAGRSVIDINKATSRQEYSATRAVVKISQRSARNKPKNNGTEFSMVGATIGLMLFMIPEDKLMQRAYHHERP